MITFTATMVKEFEKQPRDLNLRWGQQFHQYFNLDKITSKHKIWCDTLYNAADEEAKRMVKAHTDHTQ